jgi:hypothetical protein
MRSNGVAVNQSLSLYIPHVFLNYTAEDIANVFEGHGYGKVRHVDLVPKPATETSKPYNAAYVHFVRWNETSTVANFQERVTNPDKKAHLVYDDPWYWIVLENKTRRHIPSERQQRIYVPENQTESDESKQEEFLQDIERVEAECDHIISIDGRYVHQLESENCLLMAENYRLREMLLNVRASGVFGWN